LLHRLHPTHKRLQLTAQVLADPIQFVPVRILTRQRIAIKQIYWPLNNGLDGLLVF
jgi:hypothetical protein